MNQKRVFSVKIFPPTSRYEGSSEGVYKKGGIHPMTLRVGRGTGLLNASASIWVNKNTHHIMPNVKKIEKKPVKFFLHDHKSFQLKGKKNPDSKSAPHDSAIAVSLFRL